MKLVLFISAILFSLPGYALPTGDTVGNVEAVRVVHSGVNAGKSSFQIWFKNETRDRWGCLANDGHILIREDGAGVTLESYKLLFSTALTAQSTGKVLAVDSSGTSPCINANSAWIIN